MTIRRRRGSLAAIIVLLMGTLTSNLFATGKETRLEGTVKTIGQDSLTIQTKAKKTIGVKVTSATKFLKKNKPSSLSEMKVGDHAVIRAVPYSESSSTATATSTSTTTATTPSAAAVTDNHKDTISLGLSFSATQVSY